VFANVFPNFYLNVYYNYISINLLELYSLRRVFCVVQGKPVGTPDPSSFYRILQQHDVAVMFTAPTAMRALRREVVSRADSSRFRRNLLHRRASHSERACLKSKKANSMYLYCATAVLKRNN